MNDFYIECYISNNDTENTKLSSLDKKDLLLWQKDMEERALSEYYKTTIKISNRHIWLLKAALLK